ncbi:MAG: hypothetical protein Q9195_000093 [Heterodermia aff. obscurata]
MHYTISSILILAVTGFPATMGAPRPQLPICDSSIEYQITSQEDVPGSAMTGDYSVSGASGSGQLTAQTTYSFGTTVEVGADLSLDFGDIVSAGVTGSVSITTETGSTQGVSDTCPKGAWYCALSITPTMVKVSGTRTEYNSCAGPDGGPDPYTILLPKLGADGNPIINAEVCTCKNLVGWADPGHIGLLCPGDCALPPS